MKQEIAEGIARLGGEVREAIVFVDDPSGRRPLRTFADFFAEMMPYMVDAPHVDDSREAIYQRVPGE